MLDDGEPEPGAAGVAGPRDVHPIEPLEDPGQVRIRDARAAVADGDADDAVLANGAELDGAVGGGVVDGVLDEVADGVVELERVRQDRARFRGDGGPDDQALALGQRRQLAGHRGEGRLQRAGGRHQPLLPRVETGQPQQVAHQALHPRAVPGDDGDEAALLGAVFVDEGLDPAPDRGERRPQLVRDVGDEVLPDLVGPAVLGDVVEDQGHAPLPVGRERPGVGEEHLGGVGVQPHLVPASGVAGHRRRDDPGHLGMADQLDVEASRRIAVDAEHPLHRLVGNLHPALVVDHQDPFDHPPEDGVDPGLLAGEVLHLAGQLARRLIERARHHPQLVVAVVESDREGRPRRVAPGRLGQRPDPALEPDRGEPGDGESRPERRQEPGRERPGQRIGPALDVRRRRARHPDDEGNRDQGRGGDRHRRQEQTGRQPHGTSNEQAHRCDAAHRGPAAAAGHRRAVTCSRRTCTRTA